jgi:hypothetical protein
MDSSLDDRCSADAGHRATIGLSSLKPDKQRRHPATHPAQVGWPFTGSGFDASGDSRSGHTSLDASTKSSRQGRLDASSIERISLGHVNDRIRSAPHSSSVYAAASGSVAPSWRWCHSWLAHADARIAPPGWSEANRHNVWRLTGLKRIQRRDSAIRSGVAPWLKLADGGLTQGEGKRLATGVYGGGAGPCSASLRGV